MTDQETISALEKDGLAKMARLNISRSAKHKIIWEAIANYIGCEWTTIRNARRKGLGKSKSKLLKIYAKEHGVIK